MESSEPDILTDLEEMWPEFAGCVVGDKKMSYTAGQIAAVLILAAEEIRELRSELERKNK